MNNVLTCPVCKNELLKEGRSYRCCLNHNFDLAKEGYLYLLAVHKKNSKAPGDNAEMILARRTFLETTCYQPLVDALADLNSIKKTISKDSVILDAGCGEAYYDKIFEPFNAHLYGFDISKYGIKKAAKKYRNNFYFVASVNEIPIKDKSVDCILSIFAPLSASEFHRVLKEKGILIIVSSGPNHLRELAEIVYQDFRPHPFNIPKKITRHFHLEESKDLMFDIHLTDTTAILSLLKMTPYYWRTSKTNYALFESLKELKLTCDFKIMVYKT